MKFDFRAFGEIPVRFNYRVTTIDFVARNLLQEFSGRPVWYDSHRQERPAVEWYLDLTASDRPLSHRLLLVENAALRESLDLPARNQPGPLRDRYSADEVLKHQETLNALYNDAVKRPAESPEQVDSGDRAVAELMRRLVQGANLRRSFQIPQIDPSKNAEMIRQEISEIEAAAVPLPIPPTAEASRWQSYAWEGLLSLLRQANGDGQPNPIVQSYSDILTAYENADANAFNLAVAIHKKNLAALEDLRTPFSLEPPADWVERGLPAIPVLSFYEDTRSLGTKLISLFQETPEGNESSTFNVNYFEGQIAETWKIVNHWRFADGLAPRTQQEIEKQIEKKTIAGLQLEYVTFTTTPTSPQPGYQLVGAILHRGDSHWVMTLFAPLRDEVTPSAKLESILNDFELGEVTNVYEWLGAFSDSPAVPTFGGMRILAALVPDGQTTWVFEIADLAPCVEINRAGFVELIKSIRFSEPKEGDQNLRTDRDWRISWKLPANARLRSSGSSDFAAIIELVAAADRPVFIRVKPLAQTDDRTTLSVANLLRRRLGIEPALRLEEVMIEKMLVGDTTAAIFDIRRTEKLSPDSPIDFDVPQGWWLAETNAFNVATLEFSADCQTFGTITVSQLPEPIEGEGRLAWINRWRAQLMLPAQQELGVLKAIECLGTEGTLVDLFDPDATAEAPQRILAAIVTVKDRSWIFKMQSTRGVVEQQQKSFKRLLGSAKLHVD